MSEDWYQNEFAAKHIAAAREWALTDMADRLDDSMRNNLASNRVQSPLEAAFLAWWIAASHTGSVFDPTTTLLIQHEAVCGDSTYRLDAVLYPPDYDEMTAQAKVLPVKIPKIAIELDGHDFHERTKEQVTYRNKRDRDLAAAGWTVLHFSGSEFNRDPLGCIEGATSAASAAFWSFRHQVWSARRGKQ